MPSQTAADVCNHALGLLGKEARVKTLGDTSPDEVLWAVRFYDVVRSEILAMHPWGFATRTDELVPSVNPDGSKAEHVLYKYVYDKPAGSLRILNVHSKYSPVPFEFEVEGDKVLAHCENLYAQHVWDFTDVAKFSPLFENCFAYLLAARVAAPLGMKEDGTVESMLSAFTALMPVASGVDATESRTLPLQEGRRASWTSHRS